jgi:hypothetical protein
MTTIKTVPLLAAAYIGKSRIGIGRNKIHTHAAVIDDDGDPVRLLCGNASVESVADSATWTDDQPSCKRCQVRLRMLREGTRKKSQ